MATVTDTVMSALRPDLIDREAHKYHKSKLLSSYERDTGLIAIPVMGAVGTAPVITRVHAPMGTRRVEFEYIRSGAPPVFPAPADTNTSDTFVSSSLVFPAPTETNGNLIFGVRGTYLFIQPDDGRGTESLFPVDAHPFPTLVNALGTVNPQMVDPNLFGGVNTWRTDSVDARALCGYNIMG